MEPPRTELARISLDRTNGIDFERFTLQFLAAILGANFVPLGGQHDGGADGLINESLYEHPKQTGTFMQASIEQDYRSKIRHTVRRLNAVNRHPSQLLYITNQTIQYVDKMEEELSTELEIILRIRDGNYVINHIPHNTATIAAYYEYLHHHTAFLEGVGKSNVISHSRHISEPHVYTYLVGELEKTSDGSFADGVVDAMIVYALEDTDPDNNIRMSEEDIRSKIVTVLPAAEPILASRLHSRLIALSEKGVRRIRRYQKENLWVLPYEERQKLQSASIEDEALRLIVKRQLSEKFNQMSEIHGITPSQIADLTLATVQFVFEEDGLRFSRFLADQNWKDSSLFVSDSLRSILTEKALTGDIKSKVADHIYDAIRSIFYSSTPEQRTLLDRISRAYCIGFALNCEPRVLQYFDKSLSNARLYVGADVLIRALSERYVRSEDQHTRNLLRSASKTGATLVLAAPVLEEIFGHIKASNYEYHDYVEIIGGIHTYEAAHQVPKILVRAFLYSHLDDSQGSDSWEKFIGQFCDYSDLTASYNSYYRQRAELQLQRYLTNQFGLKFEGWNQIKAVCDDERHRLLQSSIRAMKSSDKLASNDAYIYQLVTHYRSQQDEEMSEYGFQTWWLSSGEGGAVRAMAQADQNVPQILMRPGYLAKFIQLAPSASDARRSLSEFLPSLLGIKLARRVTESDFHKMIRTVKEAESLEEGSLAAKLAYFNDKLKEVRYKELDDRFSPDMANEFLSINL